MMQPQPAMAPSPHRRLAGVGDLVPGAGGPTDESTRPPPPAATVPHAGTYVSTHARAPAGPPVNGR